MKTRVWCLILLLCCLTSLAQMAPRETVSATINGKSVAIEYGRPSLKGRSFEEMTKQLPADRIWRAGSEQVTTLTTAGEIMIGDRKIPAGQYSLYVMVPEEGNPSLVINRVLGQPLGKIWDQAPENLKNEPWPHFNYSKEIEDQEVARVTLHKKSGGNVDMWTIGLSSNAVGAELSMSWGTQVWMATVLPAVAEGSH